MKTVYLAGPISGCDYSGATDWREMAEAVLGEAGIKGLSPMRAKAYLADVKVFVENCEGYGTKSCLSSNRGIMTRDRFDATRCDVLLVNLMGATRVSTGTVMEMAWADLKRTPIVVAMEPEGNPHEHGMVLEAIGFRTSSLAEALDVVKAILL